MEILAPVGGQEQLLAAVRCGADAVYLGAKGFNARRNAENFGEGSLAEAVAYCHGRNVRVYVTVNTLITDDERPALLDTLEEVADSGADAIIVQDLAVASLARKHCPSLELHASTQMTIHNAAGLDAIAELGFTRAVLARELTVKEIAAMHQHSDIQLEVFVHGALCMSVSGACYLSSMLGGRSGNRGLCAQPCRLDFQSDGRAYALSLKDLSAFGHLEALGAAGVHSLKIEGRMKRPEYVAAAVTACRQALAGEPYDLETLEAAFSRGGFTDGYLTGKRNLSMFGTRGHEDVQASQRVQKPLALLYQHERHAVPVDMTLSLAANVPAVLDITDGEHAMQAEGPVAEAAIAAPTDHDRAARSLSKTGESPFYLRNLTLHNEQGLMLPASALNAMRRDALSALLALREGPHPKPFLAQTEEPIPAHHTTGFPYYRLRFESASQIPDSLTTNDQIVLPLTEITPELAAMYAGQLLAEIPALVFPDTQGSLADLLSRVANMGVQHALCHNLGAIKLAQAAGLAPHGGYGLNILNSTALAAYASIGLADATVSFELHAKKIENLGGTLPRGAIVYGYLPLMQLRCCPAAGPKGCGSCNGHPTLTDRKGMTFPLLCHDRAFSTLLNSVPLNLSGEALQGVDFYTLRFTKETAAECRRVLDDFRSGTPTTEARTRGLYYRPLQ